MDDEGSPQQRPRTAGSGGRPAPSRPRKGSPRPCSLGPPSAGVSRRRDKAIVVMLARAMAAAPSPDSEARFLLRACPAGRDSAAGAGPDRRSPRRPATSPAPHGASRGIPARTQTSPARSQASPGRGGYQRPSPPPRRLEAPPPPDPRLVTAPVPPRAPTGRPAVSPGPAVPYLAGTAGSGPVPAVAWPAAPAPLRGPASSSPERVWAPPRPFSLPAAQSPDRGRSPAVAGLGGARAAAGYREFGSSALVGRGAGTGATLAVRHDETVMV